MAKVIYSLLLLCICLLNNAQSLHFDNYTTKDGLVSDEVYKIFQDKKGYIWLFTNYGAMKYNGKIFEPVLKNLSFNESFIYSYYENGKGQIWVANSNAKIYEVRNDSAFVVKGTEAASIDLKATAAPIDKLYVDDSLNIYAMTSHYSYKFYKNKNYEQVNLSLEISDSTNIKLLVFKKDVVSIRNYKGYERYELVKKTIAKTPKLLKSKSTQYIPIHSNWNYLALRVEKIVPNFENFCIMISAKGQENFKFKFLINSHNRPKCFKKYNSDIYFTINDKIIRFNHKAGKEIQLKGHILDFIKDKNNHLWLGTYNNGLFELDENDSVVNHYFEKKSVNHILFDTQGGLWVSTEGSGLFHCKELNQLHFKESESLRNSISFIKKIGNQLFIGTSGAGVYLISNKIIKKVDDEDVSLGEPLNLMKDENDFILNFRRGAKVFNINDSNVISNSLKLNISHSGYLSMNIGKDSIIIIKRKGITVSYKYKVINVIYFGTKTYWCELRNKIIYVATEDGVYQFINNQLVMPKYLEPTKSAIITKIVKDPRGNYWFCSKGSGLFKLNQKNELIHYSNLQGLPSSIVNDINFKEDNHILLSTNKGLFINTSSNDSLGKWTQLYAEDVKSAVSFNKSIYLSTNNGLVIIKENKAIDKNTIYFNLATIMVNGIHTNQHMLQSLNYNQNNISFLMDVISYSTPIPDVHYLLEGSKKQEGTISTQRLSFSNLEPGKYTLTLQLASKEHQVNPIIIPFTIIPAFWQTLWFKLLLVVVFLLLCFLIAWQFLNYFKRREKRKNETTKLITEYKLIALKAQINPHFMSNCLTAIQHLILTNKVNEANQYLAKFSLLVRQVLNFSSKSLVTLDDELDITQLNIELEQLRFEHKFVFEIHYNDNLNLKTILIPPLLIQPITENAIWHGLLPLKKTRKGLLLIKINIVNELLHIVIEDNGVGRKMKKVDIGNIQESKGILITKQRIQNLNVYYHTNKADLIYEDLVDSGLNPSGTRVTIILPLNLQVK